MITVEQLLEKKSNEIWTIAEDATVFECIKIMDDKNIGALFVMGGEKMVGIVSERDYARKVILKGRSSNDTKVGDIMTSKVFSAQPSVSIEECMVIMNEKHIRHLPVLDGEHLLGMVSVGDVVKEIIEEQKYAIQRLEDNISWAESY